MKKLITIIVLVGIGWVVLNFTKPYTKEAEMGTDPMNISYEIQGRQIKLTNGKAELEIAPGSASREKIAIWGQFVKADLDKDGDEDAVAYLTQETRGSGVFFYVVVALNENGKWLGTNAMFLGDRIAPQNINIFDGKAVANFAERMASENFTVRPSVGKSVWIYIDKPRMQIGEAVQNFEGESRSE